MDLDCGVPSSAAEAAGPGPSLSRVTASGFQQSGDGPTTPTPYPDGLVVHHVDGETFYPEAYTGVRPPVEEEAWYHALGFHYDASLDFPEFAMWEWWGIEWPNVEPPRALVDLLFLCFVYGPLLLPILFWVRSDRLRPVASLLGWVGVCFAAVLIWYDDGDMDFVDLARFAMLCAVSLLFLARSARSVLRGALRYAAFSALVCFPGVVLAVIDPGTWMSDEILLSLGAWVVLLPLALLPEVNSSKQKLAVFRRRGLLLASILPASSYYLENAWGVRASQAILPWVIIALGLAACAMIFRSRGGQSEPPLAS